MQPGELLFQVLIAILSAYLAASHMLANGILAGLEHLGWHAPVPTVVIEPVSEDHLPPRPEPVNLARILLDNLAYQEAAALGATSSRDTAEAASIDEALVNIICTHQNGGELRSTTGSGAFIDEKGIILTNAHVAQFLLFAGSDQDASCIVRQGSPAEDRYRADLLFLSPLWVGTNAADINAEAPEGTGEHDYALLFVTEAITGDLPERFPALAIDTVPRELRDLRDLRVAGYPGTAFAEEGPRAELTPSISETTLVRRLTFGSGTADLIAIDGTPVGEYGASGGPIIDGDDNIIGLVVTRGNPERDGDRSLRALTLSYINTAIEAEAGFNLETMLGGDVAKRSKIFKDALAPAIAAMLE